MKRYLFPIFFILSNSNVYADEISVCSDSLKTLRTSEGLRIEVDCSWSGMNEEAYIYLTKKIDKERYTLHHSYNRPQELEEIASWTQKTGGPKVVTSTVAENKRVQTTLNEAEKGRWPTLFYGIKKPDELIGLSLWGKNTLFFYGNDSRNNVYFTAVTFSSDVNNIYYQKVVFRLKHKYSKANNLENIVKEILTIIEKTTNALYGASL